VAKINAAYGTDAYPDGTTGTVIAVFGPSPDGAYGYIVRFDAALTVSRGGSPGIGSRAFIGGALLAALPAEDDPPARPAATA